MQLQMPFGYIFQSNYVHAFLSEAQVLKYVQIFLKVITLRWGFKSVSYWMNIQMRPWWVSQYWFLSIYVLRVMYTQVDWFVSLLLKLSEDFV